MLIHNHLSPIAFSIGPVSIRWYGIAFAVAFLLGEWSIRKMLEWEHFTPIDTGILMVITLIGTIIGARIFHCAFYDPNYYMAHPLKLFFIWEGGLASHGGALGLILALKYSSRKFIKGSLLLLLDRTTIAAAFGGCLIRLANYANSEILGIPTGRNFGVVFDAVDQVARYPVQLYEASAYLSLSILLLGLYFWTNARTRCGFMTGIFMIGVFAARIFLEPLKMPQASYEVGYWASVGQSLSVPFIVFGLTLVAQSLTKNGRSLPLSLLSTK